MLQNPNWDKPIETKADPFSLNSLIAWLEQQPAHGAYEWGDCRGGCLIGQFMAHNGVAWSNQNYIDISWRHIAQDVPMYTIATKEPRTFGAALERARAASDR